MEKFEYIIDIAAFIVTFSPFVFILYQISRLAVTTTDGRFILGFIIWFICSAYTVLRSDM